MRVSSNHRFLTHADGRPFCYLGDTAWELFHRLNRAEATFYLEQRAAQGFTVIQAVLLAELDGLRVPNAQGDLPLIELDPTKLNEPYFAHVDWVIDKAAALGLQLGLLPTWGDKWNKGEWGAGPEIFTPENARAYGELLGRRYADSPLIWIVGGDRVVENERHHTIIRAMAEGLRAGDGGHHLISFHPRGGGASSEYFHEAGWLDFNMVQSGHARNRDNYHMISADYGRVPIKPCMDAEPGYEDHPAGFDLNNGYLDDYDARKALYWALFAGAHGHTYGCHPIWQFWDTGRVPISAARRRWHEAVALPAASHMRHAHALLHSRPIFSRIPDQNLLADGAGEGTYHTRACRAADGRYALIYMPVGGELRVNTAALVGAALVAHWFDPRTGTAQRIGTHTRGDEATFTAPAGGPDWVLVLDDAARGFAAPGGASIDERDE
ncbi:MAG: glycoside hydrolase family 140 protein [Roseiflexaceae bacterium]|nr:glycoside hydrolase family 140 protein [Roseiflexaceae bacterium]